MARKKTPPAPKKQDEVINPQTKPEKLIDTTSPAAKAAEEKIANLKSLNSFLLKETMERRDQVSNLNLVLADESFLSTFERDICRLVFASRLADEQIRVEAKVDSVSEALCGAEGRLEVVAAEKEKMKKALDLALSDRDKIRLDLDVMECKVKDLEELARSKEEEMDALTAGRAADVSKILSLEQELRSAALAQEQFKSELSESRDALDSLKKEGEGLRSEVVEMEQMKAKVLVDLESLRGDFDALKKELEEKEQKFESQQIESKVQLDDFTLKLGEAMAQKDDMERERTIQEAKISGLEEEVERLRSKALELEGMCKDHAEANTLLRDDNNQEREKAEGLSLQVAELEKSKGKVEGELENLREKIAQLQEEKKEAEKKFEAQKTLSAQAIDDLNTMLREVTAQKTKVERANASLELEISASRTEIKQVRSTLSELECLFRDQSASNNRLQADWDSAKRDLDDKMEESGRLREQVGELEKSKDEVIEKLEKLRTEFDRLQEEKGEAEKRLQSQTRDSAKMMEDLNTKLEGIAEEKNQLEQAKARLLLEIAASEKEVQEVRATLSELESLCKDQSVTNTCLQADRDSAKRDLDAEIEVSGSLREQVGELEKSKGEMIEKLEKLRTEFDQLQEEKGETEKRLQSQTRDSAKMMEDLNTKLEGIAGEKNQLEQAKARLELEIAASKKEVQEVRATLSELESLCKDQSVANTCLQADWDSAKRDLDAKMEESCRLREQVGELEKSKDEVIEKLEKLRTEFDRLQEEKGEAEKRLQSQTRDSAKMMEDLNTKLEGIAEEKNQLEQAKARLVLEIAASKKEVQEVRTTLSELESLCKDQSVANTCLQADRDSAKRDLDAEIEVSGSLREQVGELEKSKGEMIEKLEKLRTEFAQLQEEKGEAEKRLQFQARESAKLMEDLNMKLEGITEQKNQLEQAKARLELVIDASKSEVQEVRSTLSEIKRLCKDQSVANAHLQADRDTAKRDLDAEMEQTGRLRAKVTELEKSNDEMIEELSQLEAKHGGLIAEHHETKREMNAAKVNYERTLTMVKSASKAMLAGDEEGQENGLASEIGGGGADEEEVRHFAAELQAIKTAFRSRAGAVKDLMREVELLQGVVAEAEKKKGFLPPWLLPATTTATALAAGVVAYVAKGR